jgi:hypothetical protein
MNPILGSMTEEHCAVSHGMDDAGRSDPTMGGPENPCTVSTLWQECLVQTYVPIHPFALAGTLATSPLD